MFGSENGRKSIQVAIFNGGFIASFREASPSAAWHVDLTKNASLSLVVREEGAVWTLGTVEAGRTFTPIANFNHRDDAEEAFDVLRKAMAKCRCRPVYTKDWVKNLAAVAVLVALVAGGLQLVSYVRAGGFSAQQQTVIKYGEPMDADSLLQKQR